MRLNPILKEERKNLRPSDLTSLSIDFSNSFKLSGNKGEGKKDGVRFISACDVETRSNNPMKQEADLSAISS